MKKYENRHATWACQVGCFSLSSPWQARRSLVDVLQPLEQRPGYAARNLNSDYAGRLVYFACDKCLRFRCDSLAYQKHLLHALKTTELRFT